MNTSKKEILTHKVGLPHSTSKIYSDKDDKPLTTPAIVARRALSEVVVNTSEQKVDLKERPVLISKVPRIRRDTSDLTYVSLKKRHIFNDQGDKLLESSQPKRFKTKNNTDITEENPTWRDLDSNEKNDICMVVEYTDDIFKHLYEREIQTTPLTNYLTDSEAPFQLRPSMRAILVDWLVEVHEKFQCYPETLFLSINLMDRFLSKNKVTLSKLQLLAVTSLFISAKFEEVNLPKLSDYAYITDGAASPDDIKSAEMFMLTSLQFNLGWPNPMNFLRRISKADGYDFETRNIAKMLLEFALCCHKFIGVIPSVISAMSMYIARRVRKRSNILWDETLQHYSGDIDALNDLKFQRYCKDLIEELVSPSTKLDSLLIKFDRPRYGTMFGKLRIWCKDQIENDFDQLFKPVII